MTTYSIEPVREALHGSFSREYPAILTIDSGDTIRFRTLNASWILNLSEDPPKRFEPRLKERDAGHALCGPVAISTDLVAYFLVFDATVLRVAQGPVNGFGIL